MAEQPPAMPTAPPPPPIDPREAVKTPALLLMIAAGIGAAWCVLMILLNILGTGLGAMSGGGADDQFTNLLSGGIGILINVVGLAIAALIVYGAMEMKALRNYNLAMVAAIAAMVPCVSPCCLVGLPAGVWAVMVITKPAVKAAFAKK